MVGIAGRSNGCTTCRRRKIRCDEGKPACSNCLETERTCEGYAKFPVFINRTQAGIVHCPRLQEAKPLPTSALNEAQLISWFWESSTNSSRDWLYITINIPFPTPALHQSLRALAVTRYGRLNHDQHWCENGRLMYTRALNVLRNALRTQPLHDETLASARMLVLYEFLESTSEDPSAWETHLSGIARLLEVRGRPESMLAKAVFEDVRHSLMVKAIMRRERSPFCEQKWLWEEEGVQRLWNCGFQLAAILEASERHENVVNDCVDMYRELERLEHQDTDLLHLWSMQLLLLTLLEKMGGLRLGDKEVLARKMMSTLHADMEKSNFQSVKLLCPINTLLWHYRHARKEFQEVITLKRRLSDNGFALARDINKGDLPVVNVLRDDRGLTDKSEH